MSWFGGGGYRGGRGRRVQPPRPTNGAFALITSAEGRRHTPAPRLPDPRVRHEEPYDRNWAEFGAYMGIEPERHTLVDETVTVDGVTYDAARIRALLLERHALAESALQAQLEAQSLRVRLRQADYHLRKRTSALTRLIARKGPHLDMTGR